MHGTAGEEPLDAGGHVQAANPARTRQGRDRSARRRAQGDAGVARSDQRRTGRPVQREGGSAHQADRGLRSARPGLQRSSRRAEGEPRRLREELREPPFRRARRGGHQERQIGLAPRIEAFLHQRSAMTLATSNPLLQPWNTPYGLPPFADIAPAHFKPAFDQALKEQLAEVDAIGASPQPPSFDNTLAAFDRSGRLLARLDGLFYNLTSSETSPALHAERAALGLTPEQLRLLERVHLDFVRAGAKLAPTAQARYAQIMERLAELTTRFAQNVLADEASYQLVLRTPDELAGLPDFVCAAARQAAVERGVGDACVITLSRSHIVPFLTFSDRRDLREQAWRAWTTRGEHAGEHDNREIAREILTLRNEQARLHGHSCYADYALADTMAGSRAAVTDLLTQVWGPA